MPTGTKTRPNVTERAIAGVLDAARERQGITQAELAAAVGISQSQVSNILAGRKPMTMSEMLDMCGALGLVASEVVRQAERETR
jgi:transcriptional regulator with XRE-family HTH domain